MNTRLFLLLVCTLIAPRAVIAQGTAFTYQGRLHHGDSPANGQYELSFSLHDAVTNGAPVGTPITIAPVAVSNGLFTVTLDFGASAFMGADRWLEIAVTVFGSDQPVVTLQPRQPLTPTPYAIHAANAAGLMNFANAPLDIKVNGQRALRLEPNATSPNIIGGFRGNVVSNGVAGGTIGGGGALGLQNIVGADHATVAGGIANIANGVWATVSGGFGNSVRVGARLSTVAGGTDNIIWPNAIESAIGGGGENEIRTGASFSVIAGGKENTVDDGAFSATIGGGYSNHIESNAPNAVIAGGFDNRILAGPRSATISGGENNTSAGAFSTVAGGTHNTTAREYSTIGGGELNVTAGFYATVAGGRRNTASGGFATVAGGYDNTASEETATVGGGFSNTAGREAATIAGGANNTTSGDYATIGGGWGNSSSGDAATVAGGLDNTASGQIAAIGGGERNTVSGWLATCAGGEENSVAGFYATVGGGSHNQIGSNASNGTIGGGIFNAIAPGSLSATIGGGGFNRASGIGATVAGGGGPFFDGESAGNTAGARWSTVSGGALNAALGTNSTVGGGSYNVARGESATIPGGYGNNADGAYSFAAGENAFADHAGAFVWADASFVALHSSSNNQFTARASGGVRFFTDTNATTGAELAPGSGTWSSLSDRNAKENFAAANAREILAKVAALPMTSWNYKAQGAGVRHLGPMAQDFHAAFGLGESDRSIATVDADGVALAAIQGLNAQLEEELKAQNARITELERRLADIEKLLKCKP